MQSWGQANSASSSNLEGHYVCVSRKSRPVWLDVRGGCGGLDGGACKLGPQPGGSHWWRHADISLKCIRLRRVSGALHLIYVSRKLNRSGPGAPEKFARPNARNMSVLDGWLIRIKMTDLRIIHKERGAFCSEMGRIASQFLSQC